MFGKNRVRVKDVAASASGETERIVISQASLNAGRDLRDAKLDPPPEPDSIGKNDVNTIIKSRIFHPSLK